MRAAGPGTHPLTDLLFHGRHPFPRPVEHLILEIHAVNPQAWLEFAEAAEGWARIREDSCGRVLGFLGRILDGLERPGERSH